MKIWCGSMSGLCTSTDSVLLQNILITLIFCVYADNVCSLSDFASCLHGVTAWSAICVFGIFILTHFVCLKIKHGAFKY